MIQNLRSYPVINRPNPADQSVPSARRLEGYLPALALCSLNRIEFAIIVYFIGPQFRLLGDYGVVGESV